MNAYRFTINLRIRFRCKGTFSGPLRETTYADGESWVLNHPSVFWLKANMQNWYTLWAQPIQKLTGTLLAGSAAVSVIGQECRHCFYWYVTDQVLCFKKMTWSLRTWGLSCILPSAPEEGTMKLTSVICPIRTRSWVSTQATQASLEGNGAQVNLIFRCLVKSYKIRKPRQFVLESRT